MDRKLLDYLPPVLQPIREYRAILDIAEQAACEEMWESLTLVLDQQFLQTAGPAGVARREKLLGICPKDSQDDALRRFAVQAGIIGTRPFTLGKLRRILDVICPKKDAGGPDGYSLTLEGCTLDIRLALGQKGNLWAVTELLERMLPANILFSAGLAYNRHGQMCSYTHGGLAQNTHKGLTEEEFV